MDATFTVREALEQAIQTERLGYKFYTFMADRFKDSEGLKRLFDILAQKETEHEKTFRGLMERLGETSEEGWDEVTLYLRAIVESEFFLGKNKSLPSMDGIRDIEDAVHFAIGFEKETLLYFFGIKDAVKEKDIIDEVINEEKSHIRWLVNFKNGLQTTRR